jgi:DNA-directed RNA polymerase subunit RPC12/RpoP
MALVSACDVCGYRPRLEDTAKVETTRRIGEDSETIEVLYVRCYHCGHEWVE